MDVTMATTLLPGELEAGKVTGSGFSAGSAGRKNRPRARRRKGAGCSHPARHTRDQSSSALKVNTARIRHVPWERPSLPSRGWKDSWKRKWAQWSESAPARAAAAEGEPPRSSRSFACVSTTRDSVPSTRSALARSSSAKSPTQPTCSTGSSPKPKPKRWDLPSSACLLEK